MNEITLCGKPSCCPTVHVEEENVVLRDDYGGEVKLTQEEFERLKIIDLKTIDLYGHLL